MELQKEDAEGWFYRGEGAANIVLAYQGDRPSFVRFFCFQTSSSARTSGSEGIISHCLKLNSLLIYIHLFSADLMEASVR